MASHPQLIDHPPAPKGWEYRRASFREEARLWYASRSPQHGVLAELARYRRET